MPSMMRRIRTRLPTYLSTGFGALMDMFDAPLAIRLYRARQNGFAHCQQPSIFPRSSEAMQREFDNELTGGFVSAAKNAKRRASLSTTG
jgi:hypothetical protein